MAPSQFALEGVHFCKFKEGTKISYVCKIFPCVDVFQSCKLFHNHALGVHKLFEKKPEAKQEGSKGKAAESVKRTPAKKRKQGETATEDGGIFCNSYICLRGNCPVRWHSTKKDNKASFERKSRAYFDVVYGKEPEMPISNLLVEGLQRTLKMQGHAIWDCLLDDKTYDEVMKKVTGSVHNNDMYDWCTMLEDSLPSEMGNRWSEERKREWIAAKGFCRALKRVYKKKDSTSLEEMRTAETPVRDLFVKGVVFFLERVRMRLQWFQNTSEEKIMGRADATYTAWKKENKEGILEALKHNVYYTLTTNFGCTHQQAIKEGLLEKPVQDSSDGSNAPPPKVHKFTYCNTVTEKSQHIDTPEPQQGATEQTNKGKKIPKVAKKKPTPKRKPASKKKPTTVPTERRRGRSANLVLPKPAEPLVLERETKAAIVADSEGDSLDAFAEAPMPRGRKKLQQKRPAARDDVEAPENTLADAESLEAGDDVEAPENTIADVESLEARDDVLAREKPDADAESLEAKGASSADYSEGEGANTITIFQEGPSNSVVSPP